MENLIELLAPARSAVVAIAAIDAGADAVYIGGELFSARGAAGNSVEDIAKVCGYAHQFGARVYLALNTLLESPQELAEAKQLAQQCIRAGIDAIIFQDVRLLDMGLNIEMHASTQTFNNSACRVVELQQAGVRRVVLERSLSLDQIRTIRSESTVELEAFIHGAICVGYSGVCSLSAHLTGRSGNRGECAQPCRSNYDLVEATGRVLVANKALLSPRDMNLSRRIGELIDAGVCSLKIEGRLKDERYVSNVVAHYDTILRQLGVRRSSWGVAEHHFTPDVRLSFNRGMTEWFIDGATDSQNQNQKRSAINSPSGEAIGVVRAVDQNSITINSNRKIDNGDGLCFAAKDGSIQGVRVNRAEGNRLFVLQSSKINVGTELFRNNAVGFKPKNSRKIEVTITVDDNLITIADPYQHSASIATPQAQEATNVLLSVQWLRNGLSKGGNTIFKVTFVDIRLTKTPFWPQSQINSIRRELLDALGKVIEADLAKQRISPPQTSSNNIQNSKPDYLLRSRFCILGEQGLCLKRTKLCLPLHLRNNGRTIDLDFNCSECQMTLLAPDK